MTKSEQISTSLKSTKDRRKMQECRVFEVKVVKNSMTKKTREDLNRLFLEAKWLYNHALAQENVFDVSDKLKEVRVKVIDEFESRELKVIGSQIKQSVLDGLTQNIISLSKSKKKGNKVGTLKFKSYENSIDLKQFGKTYRFKNGKFIKVQGIRQQLRVRGLKQFIKEDFDIANAKLLRKAGDYYFHITCYGDKQQKTKPKGEVGIDFGIKHQLTLSNGIRIDYRVPDTARLRRLYRKFSKQKRHSNNRYKTLKQIQKEFAYLNNCKKDIHNKIVYVLNDTFGTICYQDDHIKAWQRIWGKRIFHTGIGGIIARLKKSATSVEIDRFFPSTKRCSECGHHQDMGLDDRVYLCKNCGKEMDRDCNSANNMLDGGLREIGAERTELTPVEMEASTLGLMERLNAIPRLKASSVRETGSPCL